MPDTKVIVVGIGREVVQPELEIIASTPQDVILVPDFNSLTSIERQLLDETCSGKHVSFSVVLNCLYIELFQQSSLMLFLRKNCHSHKLPHT